MVAKSGGQSAKAPLSVQNYSRSTKLEREEEDAARSQT